MKTLPLLLLIAACGSSEPTVIPDPTCEGMYGDPNENTGLTTAQCFPEIRGDTTWVPPKWTDARLQALRDWTLLDPPQVPSDNPYETTPDLQPDEVSVCGFLPEGEATYRLVTYATVEEAEDSGATVTHGGACGLCSSLEDLAAYAATPDLTQPVRACGVAGLTDGVDGIDECIQESVGFTPPCSRIWAYNTVNTRDVCLSTCLSLLDAPYHNEDGSLNECIQCDEDNSGPVFKSVAGRTRRNSGLATALCRPCETVWRIDHDY